MKNDEWTFPENVNIALLESINSALENEESYND